MTVSQLIECLEKLPQNAEIGVIYDGAMRMGVDTAFLTKDNSVALYEFGDMIYYDNNRPKSAPTEQEDKYFKLKR